MSAEAFERLRAIVLDDESLQTELFAERDASAFVALVVTIANERDLAVTDIDVWDALALGREAWLGTWSP